MSSKILFTLHNDRKRIRDPRVDPNIGDATLQDLEKKATRCKFFFCINFDTYGFYVEPGLGSRDHTHHHPMNRTQQEK